jgi:hypothetical protein
MALSAKPQVATVEIVSADSTVGVSGDASKIFESKLREYLYQGKPARFRQGPR